MAVQQNLIYDANGNLITGDGKFREYNSFNQLIKIRQGNSSSGVLLEEYIYHPVEERVLIKRVYNGTTTPRKVVLYVSDNFVQEYGRQDVAWNKVNDTYYVRDESGIVGEMVYNATPWNGTHYSKGRTLFYQNDLKGSLSVVTNTTGGIVQQTFYDPFGKILQGGNKTRFTYENREYSPRIALYDFRFRQYNPEWGKFTQPDMLIPNVYDPQSLNRYAFERNNPLNTADKTGHGDYSQYAGGFSAAGSLVVCAFLYVGYTRLIQQTNNLKLKDYYTHQRDLLIPGYLNKASAYFITGTPGQGKIDLAFGIPTPDTSHLPVQIGPVNYYDEPPTISQYYKDRALLSSGYPETNNLEQTECVAYPQNVFNLNAINQDQTSYWTSTEQGIINGYHGGGGGGGGNFWVVAGQLATDNPDATAADIINAAEAITGG